MAPTILCINDAFVRNKMAGFDFDWTLVKPLDNRKFPKSVDDWQWLFPTIPDKLKELYNEGYMIVVFTNQSKPWKQEQIEKAMSTLNIPLFIAIAFEKEEYKPNTILFDSLTTNKKFINKKNSFFVGDALGRKDDFADSDKKFAENIGIECIAPESFFIEDIDKNSIALPELPLSNENEVVIMMGYPGSGKSTIAENICTKYPNYICIQGDIYKTSKAMIKKATEYAKKKCIIFDATNSSKTKRKEYIDFAKKYGYDIKCIHVTTPLENAYQRNKMRESEKQVPRIAYSVYTKYFEPPTEDEGFDLLEL